MSWQLRLKLLFGRTFLGVRLETVFWSILYILATSLYLGLLGGAIATAVMLGVIYVPLYFMQRRYFGAICAGIIGALILLSIGAVESALLYLPIYLFYGVLYFLRARSKS
jgi:hypothetical protein